MDTADAWKHHGGLWLVAVSAFSEKQRWVDGVGLAWLLVFEGEGCVVCVGIQ